MKLSQHVPEEDSHLLKVRLEKLDGLKTKGIDPYPARYERTHTTQEAATHLQAEEKTLGSDAKTAHVSLAGRIVALRRMGRAVFIDIQDLHGRIQALFRKNILNNAYDLLKYIDIGDWIGVTGPLFRTKTGQATVEAHQWTILSKALRGLPEKWHGLTDVELRFRRRYLDLIVNEDARQTALLRSRILGYIRRFMDNRQFIEVETPILVPIAAGGTATPFSTHYKSLDRDLYLRIATELYLKRLVVGGLEKIYEIGRIFRNEGLDHTHNPEFTMLESYEAFADYNQVMTMVEQMVSSISTELLGSSTIEYNGQMIDFTPPWQRISLKNEIKERTGIDFLECTDINSLKTEMDAQGLDTGHQASWGGLMDKLISSAVEPHMSQPTFLIDYPLAMSPLAKKTTYNPLLVERFEGFAAGMEICNAFTELNDPVDQRNRLEQQEELQEQFKNEEMDRLDEEFLIAIEHGMPPTGGLGLGIDRLVMLFSGHNSIREVVLFPQLRAK